MYLFLAFLFLVVGIVLRYKEPLDLSPYEMVQEQSGSIQKLHDTLSKVSLSESYIDALQDENNQTMDQINQLQANMPSSAVAEAYPE
jgi:hypothetical protein